MGGGGGGKKGGGRVQVVDYHMSMHYGFCLGPIDAVFEMWINEKKVGLPPIKESSAVSINKPSLFGGSKEAGGVAGVAELLFGAGDQRMSAHGAAKMGRSPSTMSGYRGLFSVIFSGFDGTLVAKDGKVAVVPGDFSDLPTPNNAATYDPTLLEQFASGTGGAIGFLWGTNNPILPNVWISAHRRPKGLEEYDPPGALVGPRHANPAHIIYEVLTEDCGYLPSEIKIDTFVKAARVYRDENFGLSMSWDRQTSAEEFTKEVLAHVSTNLSFDLTVGQWELRPLRGDYDATKLPILNPSNSSMTSFTRRGWGESTNEVVVTWTNPANEEEETVSQIDQTGYEIQSGKVSDSSKNYRGIRDRDLAIFAAERELRQLSAPLASAEMFADRTFSDLKSGDLVILDWRKQEDFNSERDDGLFLDEPIVMRVLSVNPGKKGTPRVKLTLMEDIFSFGTAPTDAQASEAVSPSQEAIDVPFVRIMSAPYFVIASLAGDNDAKALEFPDNLVVVMADSTLRDVRSISVYGETTVASGDTVLGTVAEIDDLSRFNIMIDIPMSLTITIPIPEGTTNFNAPIGSFAVLYEPNTPYRQEICVVVSETPTEIRLARGVLDTVPRAHPIGTELWILPTYRRFVDTTLRSAGVDTSYWLLPTTSYGSLLLEDATERVYNIDERASLPLRPANLKLNGKGIVDNLSYTLAELANVNITWATRNRVTETGVVKRWTDGPVQPEAGQTHTLRIKVNDTIVHEQSGITGNSISFTAADLGITTGQLRLEMDAVRDGLASFQTSILVATVT